MAKEKPSKNQKPPKFKEPKAFATKQGKRTSRPAGRP